MSTRAPASSCVGRTAGSTQKGGHMPVKLPGEIGMPGTARSSSMGTPPAKSVRSWKVPVTPVYCGFRTSSMKKATRVSDAADVPDPSRLTVTSTSAWTLASRAPSNANSASNSEASRLLPASSFPLPTGTATDELRPTWKPAGSTTAMRQSAGSGFAGINSTSMRLRVPAVESTMLIRAWESAAVRMTKPGTPTSWSMSTSLGVQVWTWNTPVGPEKFCARIL
mmetsp:Transcript_8881/g.20993  ORF Transcript_8881/g.20993 Transcript_8881/m.20993 type:complete len:223 (+) Transcript_8881:254-922(+)